MNMLAMMEGETLLYTLNGGGWFQWPDGADASPAIAGASREGWVLVEHVPVPSLEEQKAVKISAVEQDKVARIVAGFSFGNPAVLYQSRDEDQENIAGASTAALGAIIAGAQPGNLRWHGGVEDFQWIAADNSTHSMDAQTMFAFGQAALAHKQAHIFAGFAHKRSIEQAATEGELEAIDITTGWPGQ